MRPATAIILFILFITVFTFAMLHIGNVFETFLFCDKCNPYDNLIKTIQPIQKALYEFLVTLFINLYFFIRNFEKNITIVADPDVNFVLVLFSATFIGILATFIVFKLLTLPLRLIKYLFGIIISGVKKGKKS